MADQQHPDSAPATGLGIIEPGPATTKTVHDPPDSDPPKKDAPPPPPIAAAQLADRALEFFSTASNETLGACLVGMSATTYLVLGRVGLVLIGVVGGVVLHASWDGSRGASPEDKELQAKRKRELGLDVVSRVMNWRKSKDAGETKKAEDSKPAPTLAVDFTGFRPETKLALEELTDAIVRDYVKWWYSPILPFENAFPTACRESLTSFMVSISNHVTKKRPADTFLDFMTNSSSIVIVFLNELSGALAAQPNMSVIEAIATYLHAKPGSHLAHILDTNHQEKKLAMVADDILQNYLEPKSYNCQPAQIFLREILARTILEKTIEACARPEFINGWIVSALEEGEPEILNVIDEGVQDATGNQLKKVTDTVAKNAEYIAGEQRPTAKRTDSSHRRVVSRAQEAMDDAMREAQRLTELIAEEDAKRDREREQRGQREQEQEQVSMSASAPTSTPAPAPVPATASVPVLAPAPVPAPAPSSNHEDQVSESTTGGVVTPTSSQSDTNAEADVSVSGNASANSTRPSSMEPASEPAPVTTPASQSSKGFTSFDQLAPSMPAGALDGDGEDVSPRPKTPQPLSLVDAKISIFDDIAPADKGVIKTKPTVDYLIQIEPSTTQQPGWMIARKYADFENLHEIIRRISVISGVVGFTEAHQALPQWKGHTKASLRGELERYLNDAVRFRELAETEGMKRFLEKDSGLNRSNSGKGAFPGMGWPTPSAFENMGKGMINAFAKAPGEVAGGGKALIGGVTGVFTGGLGQKKNHSSTSSLPPMPPRPSGVSTSPSGHMRVESTTVSQARKSHDSPRGSPIVDQQPSLIPQMERRPSYNTEDGRKSRGSRSGNNSRASSVRPSVDMSGMGGEQIVSLPPLPSNITDDYDGTNPTPTRKASAASMARSLGSPLGPLSPDQPGFQRKRSFQESRTILESELETSSPLEKPGPPPTGKPPLSEQETQVAVELFFAVINELYTLSSAWNIRKTLLGAAKTFLLRPGNPQLESIRVLLQDTMLDANTSDSGIATHISHLRQNALPTEAELSAWPAEPNDQEKEQLRRKARKLLVERGMPQALTSVMGGAASGEALGKVFDCLQVEKVARGLMFGLLLQGLRAVTQ